MTQEEFLLHQGVKKWNIISSVFFVLLSLAMYFIFLKFAPNDLSLNVSDIVILTLANYRLIRLFIYDNITLFVREYFMDLRIVDGKYSYHNSVNAFKLTMHKLLNCPWCFGVWTTFISAFFYFSFPSLKIIFILLAVAAVASFLILLSNLIGWSAEYKKIQVQEK